MSLVQGRGRARQEQSAFVVLKERNDRPHSMLAAVEKQHQELIRTFQPTKSEGTGDTQRTAQTNRELRGKPYLLGQLDLSNALQNLQRFCQKTEVSLDSKYQQRNDQFAVQLMYKSVLRTITKHGVGRSKKTAAAEAALQMMRTLREEIM